MVAQDVYESKKDEAFYFSSIYYLNVYIIVVRFDIKLVFLSLSMFTILAPSKEIMSRPNL